MIADSNSTNGVYVNGDKIANQSKLTGGETIKLGFTELKLEMDSANTVPSKTVEETKVKVEPKKSPEKPKVKTKTGTQVKSGAKAKKPSKKSKVKSKTGAQLKPAPKTKKPTPPPVVKVELENKQPSITVIAPKDTETAILEKRRQQKEDQKRLAIIKFASVAAVLLILGLIFLPKFNSIIEEQRRKVAETLSQAEQEEENENIVEGASLKAPEVNLASIKSLQPVDQGSQQSMIDKGGEKAEDSVEIAKLDKPKDSAVESFKDTEDKGSTETVSNTVRNDDSIIDYSKAVKSSRDSGATTFEKISDDLFFLERRHLNEKYYKKNIKVSGTVTKIREVNKTYTIVLGDLIDCQLEKSPEIEGKLKSMVGGRITLSGLCLGVQGQDRVVIVKAVIN